ncbi:hypothetical protein QUF81_03745 [Peribacillus simplex]|uniref:hypothetical protein n=1 Tax=Peribacillus simplex TaxID=1478 RepID=UPI0025A0C9F3|nr:hypothetical protein [Peribacillus simplex]MDM5292337.1 hypothetical protein [Peribacillus simplex]
MSDSLILPFSKSDSLIVSSDNSGGIGHQWLLLASIILRIVVGMDVPDVADAVQTGAVILPAFGITLITC